MVSLERKRTKLVIKFKKKRVCWIRKRNDSGQIEGIVDSKTWNALEKFSFRLYPGQIDSIAEKVIRELCEKSHIEVESREREREDIGKLKKTWLQSWSSI